MHAVFQTVRTREKERALAERSVSERQIAQYRSTNIYCVIYCEPLHPGRCGLNSPGLQMFMQCFQGYYVTEQMVGGSADTLQLCTLPLELLPTLYIVPLLTILSLFFSYYSVL